VGWVCLCSCASVCVGWWGGGGLVGVGGALAAEVQTSAMAVTLALANPVASVLMVHSLPRPWHGLLEPTGRVL
jgi:hypothetical protein